VTSNDPNVDQSTGTSAAAEANRVHQQIADSHSESTPSRAAPTVTTIEERDDSDRAKDVLDAERRGLNDPEDATTEHGDITPGNPAVGGDTVIGNPDEDGDEFNPEFEEEPDPDLEDLTLDDLEEGDGSQNLGND
jgi:hypothetical protein